MQSATMIQATDGVSVGRAALDQELRAARERLIDPRSREFLEDPYATYKVLREHQPLFFNAETQIWTATRYREWRLGEGPPPGSLTSAVRESAISRDGLNP